MFNVKHCHFNICYSKKIVNVRTCPDSLFSLPQVVKNAKFSPLGGSQRPNPPAVVNSLCSLRELRSYCSLCSLWEFAMGYFAFTGISAADQNPCKTLTKIVNLGHWAGCGNTHTIYYTPFKLLYFNLVGLTHFTLPPVYPNH